MINSTGAKVARIALASFLILATISAYFILSSGNAAVVRARSLPAEATPSSAETSTRKTTITVDYTLYEWWLINWFDNHINCQVFTEHEGSPVGAEIKYYCGQTQLDRWNNTTPCDKSGGDEKSECSGVYLYLANQTPGQKQMEVELPLPRVWVSLLGCDNEGTPSQNHCTSLPSLVLTGEETLPNEMVIRLQGTLNGQSFSCAGSQCSLPLQPTGLQGQTVEFWADSSYGDSSEKFTARVRVIPWGDFMAPEGETNDPKLWYVDVLSTQWKGPRLASCSEIWNVFPEIGGAPGWLQTPTEIGGLYSTDPYYFLAGMLIRNGVVDASACPAGGMQTATTASACGLEAATPYVLEWQNRFDSEILQVAGDTGVPAQLLKNIFSRESQFWPGIYQNLMETGLGQMTENGADAVLLWNPTFYDQFCPLVLHKNICALGFGNLNTETQGLLRAALVNSLNATCVDCPAGINLKQANFSVRVFAETMLANCEQTDRVIRAATQREPGEVSTYSDLWRYTLVNYNAGPGCLMDAVQSTLLDGQVLDWENLQNHFAPACAGARDYVEDITRPAEAEIAPTPWIGLPAPEDAAPAVEPASPAEVQPTLEPGAEDSEESLDDGEEIEETDEGEDIEESDEDTSDEDTGGSSE